MCRIMSFHKRVLRSLGNGPARRSLFGPVDREQLQAEYRDALRKDVEDASRRWGFDFASEKPLDGGDFQWEGVPGARVPALYRACTVGEEPRPQTAESISASSTSASASSTPSSSFCSAAGKENVPKTPERYASLQQNLENTPEKQNSLKRKQTNITDFYQAKRRVVATPRKSGQ
uniref:Cyclin dependent kinase inhibitor 1A n=2 Tax=Astyanax mexicanus TaxID=7994 RepID=A0A8B9LA65_ASTMX